MRSRTLILVILAVILAGATALLARSWLAAERSRDIAQATPVALPTPSKSVLVARNDIKRGQLLKPDDMVWQVWPEGGIASSYIVLGTKKPEDFAGWVARDPVGAGEPITEKKILAPGNRGFLAAVLRPGTRAISVQVTPTSDVSGFIFPGDQVDMVMTYTVNVQDANAKPQNNNQNNEHKVAETFLHDIRVVAIDQHMESKPGEAVVAKTATLEVSPKQGEIVVLASRMGDVSLTLRSISNSAAPADEAAANLMTKVASSDASTSDHPLLSDSGNPIDATYTVDSDVSSLVTPLTPQSQDKTAKKQSDTVTILRGGGKGSESINPDSAPKG
jgi:pilus assembly protein CpaB